MHLDSSTIELVTCHILYTVVPHTVQKTNPEISTVSRNGGQKLGTTSGDRRKVSGHKTSYIHTATKAINNFFDTLQITNIELKSKAFYVFFEKTFIFY